MPNPVFSGRLLVETRLRGVTGQGFSKPVAIAFSWISTWRKKVEPWA